MDTRQMTTMVEQYCRNNAAEHLGFKITPIARQKTMFVEQSGESGRAIMLSEYTVDGATYWAGYSTYSQTIYISAAA